MFILFIFSFGAVIGSFLNCFIWRLHTEESINGRSHCPKCQHKISWYDNIPVLSFLWLRFRCRHCHEKISWQYPIVELIVAALFTFATYRHLNLAVANFDSIRSLLLLNKNFLLVVGREWLAIAVMTIIFIYDLRWYLILDKITLPSIIIFFAWGLILGNNWQNLLISVIIGGSFFLIQFLVSRGRWIGGGDIRLGMLMGAILGWPMVLFAIFLSYFIGSIVGIGLIVFGKKKWGSQVPLGVFLSTATLFAIFYGQQALSWYLHLIGV